LITELVELTDKNKGDGLAGVAEIDEDDSDEGSEESDENTLAYIQSLP